MSMNKGTFNITNDEILVSSKKKSRKKYTSMKKVKSNHKLKILKPNNALESVNQTSIWRVQIKQLLGE